MKPFTRNSISFWGPLGWDWLHNLAKCYPIAPTDSDIHYTYLKIKSFRGFMQQDAHEFLLQIIDNIIEETGVESESVLNNVPEIILNYKELLVNTKKKLLETSDINNRKNI
jgi:hypothetical protein